MTDEAALMRAILESPDDDLPRLVFADWLEEQGREERADFIRLQCELARLDGGTRCPICDWPYRDDGGCEPGNCSFRPGERSAEYHGWKQRQTAYHALRRRETDLWHDMARTQTISAPFYGWAVLCGDGHGEDGVTPKARYRRGFVESVTCTLAQFVGIAPRLFGSQPVLRVTLADREPSGVTAMRVGAWWVFVKPTDADARQRVADILPAEFIMPMAENAPGGHWTGVVVGRYTNAVSYPTRAAALEALSAACVAYGRANAEGMSHECGRCERQPGWAFTTGNRLRRCPDCDGTGKRPGLPPLAGLVNCK